MSAPQLLALRGATTLEVDEEAHLVDRTQELITTLLTRNGLEEGDLVSIIFTMTDDLRSANPATAARAGGITHVPLLCAKELDVEGGIPRCIRVLLHISTSTAREDLRHVYLHEARQLRTDLPT